jgi:hypothetical protein
MKKEGFFINSAVSVKHKILSCVLAFFVLISSMNLLNFEEQKKTIMKSVEVSTTVVLSQFFNISALPVSVITKLFSGTNKNTAKKTSNPIQSSKETTPIVQQHTEKATSTANETKSNKGTDTKDKNSSKASMGYSIIAGTSVISEVINSEEIKDLFIADKLTETNFVRYVERVNFVSIKKIINIKFIMMLLLAILLTRRNVGDNNIVNNNNNNKIKNKRITQLI